LAKLAALDGKLVWQKQFGDAADQTLTLNGVISDPGGNIFIAGSLNGVINFGPGNVWTSAGSSDVFVAKFTTNGATSWSERFGDPGTQIPYALSIDPTGGPVIVGVYQGTILSGASTISSPDPNALSGFVAKFGNGGSTTWLKDVGAFPNKVAVDGQNNIVLTASFSGSINLGGACVSI
jgi:hypothetical protein